jgi:hypothetical protein
MFLETIVRDRNIALVPTAPVAALVAADQQDRLALPVEGEQHPNFACGQSILGNSFMLECRLATTVSTSGRPSDGPASRNTRIAASKASASACSSPFAHARMPDGTPPTMTSDNNTIMAGHGAHQFARVPRPTTVRPRWRG